MLTILGDQSSRFCDGGSRRGFLKVGLLGLGGLSLTDVLRQRAQARENDGNVRKTSVIFVELAGGPTQFETYDPKPQAPVEYRGPCGAISTSAPGSFFCELLPAQAALLDKLTIIRSIHHGKNSHDPSSHLTQTGYYKSGTKGGPNEMPCLGSIVAKMRGANADAMPAYVAVPGVMRNGGSAFLGRSFEPFETQSDPNGKRFEVKNLALSKSLNSARLNDRKTLLASLDAQRDLMDLGGSAAALDEFTQQALDLVSGPRARQAFDIAREKDAMRDRYGRNTVGQSLLLARRLVESGVTCVTVRVTGWDDHSQLLKRARPRTAAYDQGLAALVTDLSDRGLRDDVLVVAMGEFGRTPRVNRTAGRDHWGAVMSVLLAGGKLPSRRVRGLNSGEVPVNAVPPPKMCWLSFIVIWGLIPGDVR
ncbi:MAG: DUF1501 domain-containing protein [Planctomycetaceae bacterium]|nr:DUF1501 domain-containing protein [Planctomycetaceae bacterium]